MIKVSFLIDEDEESFNYDRLTDLISAMGGFDMEVDKVDPPNSNYTPGKKKPKMPKPGMEWRGNVYHAAFILIPAFFLSGLYCGYHPRLILPDRKTMTAKRRRQFHLAVMIIWLIPGAVLSVLYAHSLAWIVFMSWFACVYAAASAYSAETPVEGGR